MSDGTRTGAEPFQFFTVANVTRSGNQEANTLRELLEGLGRCSDASIYHHLIHAFGSQALQTGSTLNDFATWVGTSAGCRDLSGRLAALDERCYTSIEEMRDDLSGVVRDYIETHPGRGEQRASSAFCFCEGVELLVPLNLAARTLEEFRTSIQLMSCESFYLHFVASNSRLEQRSNDFSVWLTESLGLDELARKINEIDLTEITLEAARERILQLIDAEPVRLV